MLASHELVMINLHTYSMRIASTQNALVKLFIIGALLTLSVSAAVSVEERLARLEQRVESLVKENGDLKKQLGWKGSGPSLLPSVDGKESKLSIGGFLQGQAEFGHAADPRWAGVRDRFFFFAAPACIWPALLRKTLISRRSLICRATPWARGLVS